MNLLRRSQPVSIFTEAFQAHEKPMIPKKVRKKSRKPRKLVANPTKLHLVNYIERRFVIKRRDDLKRQKEMEQNEALKKIFMAALKPKHKELIQPEEPIRKSSP